MSHYLPGSNTIPAGVSTDDPTGRRLSRDDEILDGSIKITLGDPKEDVCAMIRETELNPNDLKCIRNFLTNTKKATFIKRQARMKVYMKWRDQQRRLKLMAIKNQHIDGWCDALKGEKKCQRRSKIKSFDGYEYCLGCATALMYSEK
jgi:hypothetical protein